MIVLVLLGYIASIFLVAMAVSIETAYGGLAFATVLIAVTSALCLLTRLIRDERRHGHGHSQ